MHPALTQLPFDTLTDLMTSTDTIDFFTEFCATAFLTDQNHIPRMRTPIFPCEKLRLQRALLRLQLYCQLFH